MSLLTRLWGSVAVAMLLALLGTFGTSVYTAHSYLSQQLYTQGSDGATSLALSMSQQANEPAMRETLINAMFDSGYFESIIFRNTAGKIVTERHLDAPRPDAPAWFVAALPLDPSPGEALVSDGWQQQGQVEVRASARFAYVELWRGTWRMALILFGVGLVLCFAVWRIMKWAQGPLLDIVEQATAIGQRRFVTLPELKVPELRIVGRAMNALGARIQAMFAEQAARIEALRGEANHDPLTGLANRELFMGDLRAAMQDTQSAPDGAMILVRLLDLNGLNHRLGRDRVNTLIRTAGTILGEALNEHVEHDEHAKPVTLARLNGSDFGVLMSQQDGEGCDSLCRQLMVRFSRLYREEYVDREPVAAFAWGLYHQGEAPADVLLRVDACLVQAEAAEFPLIGNAGVTPSTAMRGDVWKQHIETAVAKRNFHLDYFPVMSTDGVILHREAMLRMRDESGQLMTAGQFMPMASRLGMTAALDLMTIEIAMQDLALTEESVAVNISAQSLAAPEFMSGLLTALHAAGKNCRRLWIELSERGIGDAHGVPGLNDFAVALANSGCRFGIEHFGRCFASMPRLNELSVDYLKLDGAFVAQLDSHEGNQKFIKTLVDVSRALDIQVIAEHVTTEEEWETLVRLGVAGVTGPAVTARQRS